MYQYQTFEKDDPMQPGHRGNKIDKTSIKKAEDK
jgi:hypothetical protein